MTEGTRQAHRLLERRTLLLLGVAAACLITHLVAVAAMGRQDRLLRGDARRYYIYLPSIILDHDLDFANDVNRLDGMPPEIAASAPSRAGPGNLASIGTSLFWSPFFLAALVLQAASRALFGGTPIWDGYGLLPQLSVIVAGVFYAGAAALVTAATLDRWFARSVSTGSTLAVWLATPAIYYTVISPAYSHSVGWFAVAVAIWAWLRARDVEEPRTGLLWAGAGLAFGLAAMIRPQDVLVLGVPLLDLAWPWQKRHRSLHDRLRAAMLLLTGFAIGFSPQMLIWKLMYGGALTNPLGEPAHWLAPKLASSFFGLGVYGLFTWAPLTLIALLGLVHFARRFPALGIAAVAIILLAGYFQASVYILIETGTSFGPRRFVSYNLFFALGIAALWARSTHWPRLPSIACALLVIWNGVLLAAYELLVHRHGIYPELRQMLSWLFGSRL